VGEEYDLAGTEPACGHVLVVDDDEGVRVSVAAALLDAGLDAARAADAEQALAHARRRPFDLAILDVNLPGVCGYELFHRLREGPAPGIPVIFISGECLEPYDRVAGLLLGADDFLTKPFSLDELVVRVRCVLRRASLPVSPRLSSLTKRELEILTLLAEGQDQRQIAATLYISPKTVGTHIQHILDKLDVRSRSQAIALAYREDLVSASV
jgi:two-component system response regulator MtrA